MASKSAWGLGATLAVAIGAGCVIRGIHSGYGAMLGMQSQLAACAEEHSVVAARVDGRASTAAAAGFHLLAQHSTPAVAPRGGTSAEQDGDAAAPGGQHTSCAMASAW